MALTPRSVFRYFVTDGVPSSGKHEPIKAEIIQLLEQLFGVSRGGWIVARTKAELDGITPENETDGGVVLTGAGAGYYDRDGGAWVFGRGFPDTFARVELSGTGTAQTGSVNTGVVPANIEVFFAFVTTPNTGPLTLSIHGEPPREVVNLAGAELAPGEWTGTVMFALRDGKYQLLLDAGAAASAAQSASDAAASAAEADAQADRSTTEADRAQANADDAAAFAGFRDFADVATLFANTSLEYGTGAGQVQEGDVVRTRKEGRVFQVVAADASDYDEEVGVGVRLIDIANVTRHRMVPAVAKAFAVNIREFGENVTLDGVQDNSDAFDAMVAYGAKHMLINEGTLRTTRELSRIGNAKLEFINADAIVDGALEFILVTPDADWVEVVGLRGLQFPAVTGQTSARAFGYAGNSIGRIKVEDNDFGVGRVFVSVKDPNHDALVNIERNKWRSDEACFNQFATLVVSLNDSLDASFEDRSRNRGVRIRDNNMRLWGPANSNFDFVKVSGATWGAKVEDNDIVNLNPLCGAQLDMYVGGAGALVSGNDLIDTQFHWKTFEQPSYNNILEWMQFVHNHVEITPDFTGSYNPASAYPLLFLRGFNFKIAENKLIRRWPGYENKVDPATGNAFGVVNGACSQMTRAIWVNATAYTGPYGARSARRIQVNSNHIDLDYDTNPGSQAVYPVFISGDPVGGNAEFCDVSHNKCFGGRDFMPPSTPTNTTYIGNTFVGSFDKAAEGSAAIDGGTVGRTGVGNLWL